MAWTSFSLIENTHFHFHSDQAIDIVYRQATKSQRLETKHSFGP